MKQRTNLTTRSWLMPMIFLALAVAAFATALMPINSNDIWWHLKTGDHIRATSALPDTDPFSYLPATDTAEPDRPRLILRQYWLAQVAYSLIHGAMGLSGIIGLRSVLCAGLVLGAAMFLWRATRSYAALLPLLPLVLALRVILEDSDRPHLFVFVSTLLVVLLLEDCVRTGRHRPLFLIPPLQLLAAQFHPGFAIGTLAVAVYAVCAAREPRLQPLRRPLWLTAGGCLLLFLGNPNGMRLVPSLFGNAFGVKATSVLEFQSPFSIWRYVTSDPGWLACGGLLLLALAACGWLLRRRCWSAAVVLAGLTVAAALSMRYIGFFVPVAAVFAGLTLAGEGAWSRRGEIASATAIAAAALALAIFPGHGNRGKIHQLLQPGYFPVRAADFLAREGFHGNLFNLDAWGGYLEYRLWPRHLIFTDTRVLTSDAAAAYREVIGDTPVGRELMRRHAINVVVLPPLDIYRGEIYPLVRRLGDDPQWSLVHFDDTALVFARQPHALSALAKEMVWFQVLRQIETWQPRFFWVPGYPQTRQEVLARMRRP